MWFIVTPREAGIGTSKSPGTTKQIDSHRMEIIKLLITCFSESLYVPAGGKIYTVLPVQVFSFSVFEYLRSCMSV